MLNSILKQEQKKLTESEQELYDALLDEYNDLFEQILILPEKNFFDKILMNVKAILGEKKYTTFSKMTTAKVFSTLKLSNYLQDINSLKHIKEIMLSLGKKDRSHKMPPLKINEIFSHCETCSKCYHTCGELLLKPNYFDFVLCLKCKMVYKKDLIHLYCKECDEEYYSYIVDNTEPEYENFYPATWEEYHCPNYIYEEMICPKCDWMLYYNEKQDLLKCFECGYNCLAKDKIWICEICDKEFKSKVREYFRFETKPKVNCVRDALVQKIFARPAEMPCCDSDPRYYTFTHEGNKCKGVYYSGFLQKKEMAVCSECRLVQNIVDVCWNCPECGGHFFCKKIKKFDINNNEYLIKPKNKNIILNKEEYNNNNNNESDDSDMKNNELENSEDKYRVINTENIMPKLRFSINNSNFSKDNYSNIRNTSNKNIKYNYDNSNLLSSKKKENISENEENHRFQKIKELKTKNIISPFSNKIKKNLKLSIKEKNNILNSDKKITKGFNLYDSNYKKTPTNSNFKLENNLSNFYSAKKDISLNQSSNLYLKEMKILSMRNQKYINKSKIKFNKSLNNKDQNKLLSSEKNLIKNKKQLNLNLNLNISINNYLSRSQSIKNTHSLENKLKNVISPKNYINVKSKFIEPNENFIPEDFTLIKQIGEGSFGKIYCTQWKKNHLNYALKKMILRNKIEIKKNRAQTDLVHDLIEKTKTDGVIKIYGAQCIKINSGEYHFYVLMELADIDWEKEIKQRREQKKYYTEGELYQILKQLCHTFSLLQKNNITHRDIKPQNVLIVNNVYKICDFGEAIITEGHDVIRQTIKGTELYMSPILFKALNKRQQYLIHNTYKSDVFSLGMCLFLSATLTFQSLYDIRELNDMDKIKNILIKYLIAKYSYDFVHILVKMLEINEDLRPDFVELEQLLEKK